MTRRYGERRPAGTALTRAALLALVTASAMMAHPATAAPRGQRGSAAVCIRAWKEAPYRNYGFDHIVGIRNSCERAVRCSVTTNVARRRYQVTVGPDHTARVLTFRGAPTRSFTARVACTAAH